MLLYLLQFSYTY